MDPQEQPQTQDTPQDHDALPSTALVPLTPRAAAHAAPAANPAFLVQILASNQHLGDFRRYRRVDPRQAGLSYGERAKAARPRLGVSRQA